ncbi:MAG: hypothetical protein ACD_55C00002G0001 [uncultured bacterium]|nr:MAG: hypothetical protein ACD_55C00002G0001 [uncultured bacterium]
MILTPRSAPSLKKFLITLGWWYSSMTKSVIWYFFRSSTMWSMMGRFISGTIGLGMLQVSGCMRVPKPPAIITAFIKTLQR